MRGKGPSNRGDGVNEELPHRPDTVCDGRRFLETVRHSSAVIFTLIIIIFIIVRAQILVTEQRRGP